MLLSNDLFVNISSSIITPNLRSEALINVETENEIKIKKFDLFLLLSIFYPLKMKL